jgi:hypothetical protein
MRPSLPNTSPDSCAHYSAEHFPYGVPNSVTHIRPDWSSNIVTYHAANRCALS